MVDFGVLVAGRTIGGTYPEEPIVAKFEINKQYTSSTHKQKVEARSYKQEGDYFVFYDEEKMKVLTIAAVGVHSIDTVAD